MKIFIGADHRGFKLKDSIKKFLSGQGYEVQDQGSFQEGVPCDYPVFSCLVASAVAANPGSRGILVCMSGIGHTIAANKVPGAYAALCYNKEAAVLSRQHNDANIIVLGAKFVPEETIPDILQVWLTTPFEGGRHLNRVNAIKDIEKKFLKS
jgi:RpiB/LacA/LacB family sugar-phosphate isomerase